MGITYQREPLTPGLWAEVEPLLSAHWAEIAHYADIPLDPDVEYYNRAEAAGTLRTFTVRDGERLIGYAVWVVRPNPHYRASLQAFQDILFLLPAYRGTTIGARLIRFSDDALRDEKVQVAYHHSKVAHPIVRVLERQGYEPVDVILAKRLDRG